jgi:predicted NACHT family NTPase
LQETGRKPDEVVFATTLPVTELSKQRWREEISDDFGIRLRDVIQREWIISELEKEPNRWLCKEYLEIPLAEFQNLPAILPRIRSAAQKLLNAYKGEYELPNQFLIDLSLEEFGASGATSLQLSHFPSRLGPADCCSITGVPGAGKTFSLFTIGSELFRDHSLIPFFVSLRAFSHRKYKLIDWIVSEPSFEEQSITASELSNAASSGALLLLLNGWNEIARDAWLATTEAISAFIRQMPGCGILVASRASLGRDFKFPTREFRLKSLSGDQIRTAIMQAALYDPDRPADLILNSIPLSEIAAVPLFLQAIIREIKSGNQLPLGKQAMLRRVVERAVEEHRSDLEHGEVRQHGLRYLAELAWEMTRTGRTAIAKKEAHQTISETTRKLKDEALLGAEPAPPDILEQLIAGHMLISVSRDEVAFTHQLIQEHFAATKIVFILLEKSADLELGLTVLTDYQWEQPLFLALEDLADQNRTAEIRILLDWFRFVDFGFIRERECSLAGCSMFCSYRAAKFP